MVGRIVRAAAVALLVLFVVSGCLGSKADVVVSASDARVVPPYGLDYSGTSVKRAEGTMGGSFHTGANKATVVAHVQDGPRTYDLSWASVRDEASYQSGGVARSIRLHGATGNGTGILPAFDAYAAAWGTVTLNVDGQVERDPTNRAESFAAAVYLVRGRVRDAATGAILDESRQRPYDPGKPTSGYVDPDGAQVIILLRAQDGTPWRGFEFHRVALEKF